MHGSVVFLVCLLLLFESLSVALMKAERAEVDFPTAICWEAEPLWVHHLPVLQSQSVCFWVIMCCSVQKWPQLLVRLVTLGWLEWVLHCRSHRITHRKTAEPFRLYKSHFAQALKPLNAPEPTVLGGSTRSHSCQFVNFVLFSVNVPFFSPLIVIHFVTNCFLYPSFFPLPLFLSSLCREMK